MWELVPGSISPLPGDGAGGSVQQEGASFPDFLACSGDNDAYLQACLAWCVAPCPAVLAS